MLEPYFAKSEYNTKSSGENGEVKSENDFYELGFGAFMKNEIKSDICLYWGARLSYIYSEYSSDRNYDDGGSIYSSEEDGYEFSPVLGFRYFFNEHFSIAGEAEFSYRNTKNEGETRDGVYVYKTETEYSSTYTSTNFVARYMF